MQPLLVVDNFNGAVRGACSEAASSGKQMSTLPDPSCANSLRAVITIANSNQPEETSAHHRVNVGCWILGADVSTVAKLLDLFDTAPVPGLGAASDGRIGHKIPAGFPDDIRNLFSVAFGHEEKEPHALVIFANDVRDGAN